MLKKTNAVPMIYFGLVLWLAGLSVGGWLGNTMPLIVGVVIVLIAAGPLWLAYGYDSAIRRQHSLNALIVPRWWHHLLEGHLLRLILLLLISFWFGIELLADLLKSGVVAAGWLILAAGFGAFLNRLFLAHLTNYKPYYRTRVALRLSAPVAGTLMAIAWLLTRSAATTDAARYIGSSQLLKEISDSGGLWDLVQTGLAAHLPVWSTAPLQAVSAGGYYGLVALASGGIVLLSSGEWRRVYVHGTEEQLAVTRGKIFLTSFFLSLGALIFTGLAAGLEDLLAKTARDPGADTVAGGPSLPSRPSEVREIIEREGIGGLLCKIGTIKGVLAADSELQAALRAYDDVVSKETERVFSVMRDRVPEFLDWYYSLTADYMRTGHLLIGDGNEYLSRQLSDILAPAETMVPIEEVVSQIENARAEFFAKRGALLSICGPRNDQTDEGAVKVVTQYDGEAAEPMFRQLNAIWDGRTHFDLRASGSGLAGVAAGTLVAKFGVTSSFKLAAKALAKMAGKKATSFVSGVLVGGASGGAGGSVIPGAGTGVGAIVGGIAGGIAVMVGVDFMALKLEEEISRDAFEADLLAAIDESERELKVTLLGEPSVE